MCVGSAGVPNHRRSYLARVARPRDSVPVSQWPVSCEPDDRRRSVRLAVFRALSGSVCLLHDRGHPTRTALRARDRACPIQCLIAREPPRTVVSRLGRRVVEIAGSMLTSATASHIFSSSAPNAIPLALLCTIRCGKVCSVPRRPTFSDSSRDQSASSNELWRTGHVHPIAPDRADVALRCLCCDRGSSLPRGHEVHRSNVESGARTSACSGDGMSIRSVSVRVCKALRCWDRDRGSDAGQIGVAHCRRLGPRARSPLVGRDGPIHYCMCCIVPA